MKYPLASTFALALAGGLAASSASASVVVDWVTIGDPGNLAQSAANRTHAESGGDGYGAVDSTYRISRDETTIAQYASFLNAVAATDDYGLYSTVMAEDANIAGIVRGGSDGSYSYSVTGGGDRPIAHVSWWDAARFSNWLHNGQQTGAGAALTAENGAYALNGAVSGPAPARNVGATVWIPTENEWFKAAYYDPTKGGSGGYWLHANQSDSMPGNGIGVAGAANFFDGDFAVTQSETLSSSQNYLTDVGAYGVDSQSYYGINDMAGNLLEWNDLEAGPGSLRGLRGGSWFDLGSDLPSSLSYGAGPADEDIIFGFRVAGVPEPSTMVLTMLFSAALACRRKR